MWVATHHLMGGSSISIEKLSLIIVLDRNKNITVLKLLVYLEKLGYFNINAQTMLRTKEYLHNG